MTNNDPTFTYDRKQPGDRIRSRDWNAAMQAIADLGNALRRRASNVLAGPLTIQGFLEVLGTIKATKFVGDGSGLTGLPVADSQPLTGVSPTNPQRVGEWSPEGSAVSTVYVAGKYAYAGVRGWGIALLDISNPTQPQQIKTPGVASKSTRAIAIAGHYVYLVIAEGLNIYNVYNIVNGNSQEPAGHITLEGETNDIVIAGAYAYLATSTRGLEIIDIGDPTKPRRVDVDMGSLGPARSLTIAGRYVYLAKEDGLQIVDISNLDAPEPFDPFTEIGGVQAIYVAGRYAYVATSARGLQIVDVGDPATPLVVGAGVASLGAVQGVAVAGNYAYVAAGAAGLQIVDIGDPTAPQIVGSGVGEIGAAQTVYIAGKYAYIAAGEAGLQVIDLQGPALFAAHIGAIAANTLSVSENGDIGNLLSVRNGLNVGPAGIKSDGPLQADSLTVVGTVTATRFVGDGSGLTGLPVASSDVGNLLSVHNGLNVGPAGIKSDGPLQADSLTVVGTVTAASFVGDGSGLTGLPTTGSASLTRIEGDNTLEFGAGVSGKEAAAGKIGYQTFSTDALDIVGAGASADERKLKFWAEGGAAITGSLAVEGSITATKFVGDGSGLTGLQGGGSPWVSKADDTKGIYYSGGPVTIGANNKGATLQILNRTQDASGDTLVLGRTDGSHIRLGYNTGYSWMQAGGGPLLINPQEGNVGIGTTDPKAKLDVNGYVLEKLDLVPVGVAGVDEDTDWKKIDHPLLLYFKSKLQGQPPGTMMRALTDNPNWKDYYWVAWVNGSNEVRVWRNDDKDTGILAG